jgi:hypothetical protein
MPIVLVLLMAAFLPVQAHALSLQDLVDQGTFSAGPATISNFTASTLIDGGGVAPALDDVIVFLQRNPVPSLVVIDVIPPIPQIFRALVDFNSTHAINFPQPGATGNVFVIDHFTNTLISPGNWQVNGSWDMLITPEPATAALMVAGIAGLAIRRYLSLNKKRARSDSICQA